MTFWVGDHFREVDTLEDSNFAEFYVRSTLEFHLILGALGSLHTGQGSFGIKYGRHARQSRFQFYLVLEIRNVYFLLSEKDVELIIK